MPITSKYSDQKIETMLAEIAAVLEKHESTPELSLMLVGNIATNILNQNVAKGQRQAIAKTFADALAASVED
ncbi:YejL family protein [Vibrio gallicus]|uniref:YejL family protein n=1 Tax=Vibrio gallicus TaxID=190897 RepID=UPI0021C338D9|nr:YejL family protein [Vibrio gallicus]